MSFICGAVQIFKKHVTHFPLFPLSFWNTPQTERDKAPSLSLPSLETVIRRSWPTLKRLDGYPPIERGRAEREAGGRQIGRCLLLKGSKGRWLSPPPAKERQEMSTVEEEIENLQMEAGRERERERERESNEKDWRAIGDAPLGLIWSPNASQTPGTGWHGVGGTSRSVRLLFMTSFLQSEKWSPFTLCWATRVLQDTDQRGFTLR